MILTLIKQSFFWQLPIKMGSNRIQIIQNKSKLAIKHDMKPINQKVKDGIPATLSITNSKGKNSRVDKNYQRPFPRKQPDSFESKA